MNRKALGHGLAVLALTAGLALGGARPAAAQDLGLFELGMQWLASIVPLWDETTEQIDKGLGVDPNGGGIVLEPTPLGGS